MVPMNDGNYIRIVMVPSIRMLNSTITSGGTTKNYYNFYLPKMNLGSSPRLSQSVTLEGKGLNALTKGDVSNIKVTVDFPRGSLGFDNSFFNFEHLQEEVNVPSESILEFYTSEVTVSLGLQG
jgi:hypothetical protein